MFKSCKGLLVLTVLALLGLLSAGHVASAQQKKPNILVIWGDDVGWFNISAHNHPFLCFGTGSARPLRLDWGGVLHLRIREEDDRNGAGDARRANGLTVSGRVLRRPTGQQTMRLQRWRGEGRSS
jgi:hypothetical protein